VLWGTNADKFHFASAVQRRPPIARSSLQFGAIAFLALERDATDCEGATMHRHVKILAVICILLAIGFVVGRYTMWNEAARYDASHP
jgi:hypothetical protein